MSAVLLIIPFTNLTLLFDTASFEDRDTFQVADVVAFFAWLQRPSNQR